MDATPATLRPLNQRRVLRHLLRHGPQSRARLARHIGLSAPTVGKLVEQMVDAGLLEYIDSAEQKPPKARGIPASDAAARPEPPGVPRPGRPAHPVGLNASQPRFVAIQLGVRHTRIAALSLAEASGVRDDGDDGPWTVRFATPPTPEQWQRQLEQAGEKLHLTDPWGVIVSVPGVVDEQQGHVLLSPNLHWTERADLPGLLGSVWSAPVCLVQEIRALALGHLAAEPEEGPFLLVDFGEGVGGAVVIGEQLYEGALPLSGELGHTPVVGNRRTCGCGQTGCMETLASRAGLLASFSRHLRHAGQRRWSRLVARVESHGVEPWLARTLDAVGATIAGAINVVGVSRVVITGSLVELPGCVVEALAERIRGSAMWGRFGTVEVVPAPRRRAAGLVVAGIERIVYGDRLGLTGQWLAREKTQEVAG